MCLHLHNLSRRNNLNIFVCHVEDATNKDVTFPSPTWSPARSVVLVSFIAHAYANPSQLSFIDAGKDQR